MIIIGEKINGSIPAVAKAIAERDAEFIKERARKQAAANATYIDCCASVPEEVEVETLEQLQEALEAKADIIMLDNMDNATMKEAVAMIGDKAQSECSGNVTKERLMEIAEIGVDFVSSGAITYAAPILDFSMKNLRPY